MQRRTYTLIFGFIGILLLTAAAKLFFDEYQLNKPDLVYQSFSIVEVPSLEKRELYLKNIREDLCQVKLQKKLIGDTSFRSRLKIESFEEAIAELNRRLYIDLSEVDTPQGRVFAINIGVKGVRHENKLLRQLSERLSSDFMAINGIDPKTGKPIE